MSEPDYCITCVYYTQNMHLLSGFVTLNGGSNCLIELSIWICPFIAFHGKLTKNSGIYA